MVRTQKSGDFKITSRSALLRLAAVAGLALLVAVPGWAQVPQGFTEANIGPPPVNGSITVNADKSWSIMASGNNYNGATADQFYFLYQSVTGDGSIVFRLIEQAQPGDQYVGPMVRATTAPGSVFAGAIMSTSAVNWISRTTTDQAASRQDGDGSKFSFPKFMLVQRVGNTVQGFESSDGKMWDAVKPAQDLGTGLGASALFGVSVSSRSSSLITAKVDGVLVLPGYTTVTGLESAATNNLAFLAWLPATGASGYNIYRGAAGATFDKMTLIAQLNQGIDPFFLDFTPSATPLRNMSYAITAFYRTSDGRFFEGPALRAR